MRLHFPSVAVGVAAVSIILVSMSQAGPTVSPPRVEYGPHPRDMVQVREGSPLIVPAGRVFVLTGLGNLNMPYGAFARVNGSVEISVTTQTGVTAVPPGFTVPGGSTFEVNDNDDVTLRARAWGYLAAQ